MPYTWLIRRVLIEPIQLPFLLTSILFVLYTGIRARKEPNDIVTAKSREENERISDKVRGERQATRTRTRTGLQ